MRLEDEKKDTLRLGLRNWIDPDKDYDLNEVLPEPTDNQRNFDYLDLGMTDEKRDMLCIRLNSEGFRLQHQNLVKVDEDAQHSKATEEDNKDDLEQGFSDFWDWTEF